MQRSASSQPVSRSLRSLPRNVWAVSITSFLTDVSSDMVINLIPLYLFNVVGAGTAVIGLIEGVAEMTASLLKIFSGWLSDRLGGRKWVAVAGYAISAFSKPFFFPRRRCPPPERRAARCARLCLPDPPSARPRSPLR